MTININKILAFDELGEMHTFIDCEILKKL